MHRNTSIAIVIAGIILMAFTGLSYAGGLAEDVSACIGERIGLAESSAQIPCGEGQICKSALVAEFYAERKFKPAWSDDFGPFPGVEDFLEAVRNAYREGLRPADYNLHKIEAALSVLYEILIRGKAPDKAKVAELDLMLTDGFLYYASHLLYGRVDHPSVYPGWVIYQRSADLKSILNDALASGEIEGALAELAPSHPGYERLKKKLTEYQEIAERGGWLRITPGPKLRKGSHGERVIMLRHRLVLSGDLGTAVEGKPGLFDRNLETAVRKFQRRHGLKDDGRVGRSTLNALNIPIETRIRQIALNMDRMRWLPDDFGERHIFVNIADFSLEIVEDEQPVMSMRIIAGKNDWRSCVLSSKMSYLELNPYWRIPDSIALKEILPNIRKNPDYLAAKNIKMFGNWNDPVKEVNPRSVDWSRVRAKDFTYKLRQEPGPGNPLGRIKFIFPNQCEIYLHDTPARHLFGKSRRDFSHGCIRIEKPMELAAYLLKNHVPAGSKQGKEPWTRKKLLAEIGKGKRQVVWLSDPFDIHIFYGTAWVDREKMLQFRDDIYGIDEIPYDPPVRIISPFAKGD